MRILFFGTRACMDPLNPGGVESFVRRIAVACTEMGHNTEIVLCGADRDNRRQWPFGPGPQTFQFASYRDALDAIRAMDPAVLVVAGLLNSQLPEFFRFCRVLRRRTKVAILHMEMTRSSWRLFLRTIATCGYRGPALCVSPRLFKLCCRLQLDAHLLRPPVAPVFYEPHARGAPPAERRIAYVGRLDPRKGFGELPGLFQSIARLVADGVKLRFAVRGYYSSEKVLESAAHRELKEICGSEYEYARIDCVPYTPESEFQLKQTLLGVHLLLLPYLSLSGTLDVPLLPLEAAACGCTVLTTSVADLSESLKGVAMTAPLERLPDVAASIVRGEAPRSTGSAVPRYHAHRVARDFIRILQTGS